jgi:hypothetical protein
MRLLNERTDCARNSSERLESQQTGERTGSRPPAAEGGGAKAPALRPADLQATSTQLLLGEPLVATVIGAKPLELRANLAPAWTRQDHTTSPSVKPPLVSRRPHVHRIPASRFVTTAMRPSAIEAGWRALYGKSEIRKSEIFLRVTVDRNP